MKTLNFKWLLLSIILSLACTTNAWGENVTWEGPASVFANKKLSDGKTTVTVTKDASSSSKPISCISASNQSYLSINGGGKYLKFAVPVGFEISNIKLIWMSGAANQALPILFGESISAVGTVESVSNAVTITKGGFKMTNQISVNGGTNCDAEDDIAIPSGMREVLIGRNGAYKPADYATIGSVVPTLKFRLNSNSGYFTTNVGTGNTPYIGRVILTVVSSCSATAPGNISIDSFDPATSKITLKAAGSAAAGNTWYWQASASGTSTSEAYVSAGKEITAAGTYYLRSYNGECWSDAKSIEVTAADFVVKYAITKGTHVNGDFTISPTLQEAGEEVTLVASPSAGYLLDAWNITKTEDGSATGITVTNGKFTMPAYAVTVNATFVVDPCSAWGYGTANTTAPSSGNSVTVGDLTVANVGCSTSSTTPFSGGTSTGVILGNGASKYITGTLGGDEIASIRFSIYTTNSSNTTYVVAFSSSATYDAGTVLKVSGDYTAYFYDDAPEASGTRKDVEVTAPAGAKSFAIGRNLSGVSHGGTEQNSGSRGVYYIAACPADEPSCGETAQAALTLSSNSGTICGTGSTTFTVSGGSGTGALSVSSSDPSKATASIDGTTVTVTGVAAGSATITVTKACDATYAEKTATYSATVAAIPTANAGANKATTYNTGVAMAATAAADGCTGTWTIQSGPNTSTSQLSSTSSATATFTPTVAGTYTLRWTVTNISTTCSASDEADVVVSKANISPSLSYSSTTLTVGDNSSSPTVSGNPGSGSVSYAVTSASPSGCITVNESTGVVTAEAAGSGTVTATVGATTNYNGNTCTANFTVNAAAVTYTVTYDGSSNDDGTVPEDGTSYSSGATVTVLGNTGSMTRSILDAPATFLGWNTSSNMYSGTHYDVGDKFEITSDITLYAVWGFNIYYKDEDKSTEITGLEPTYYIYGEGATLPTNPTPPTGYEFGGWYNAWCVDEEDTGASPCGGSAPCGFDDTHCKTTEIETTDTWDAEYYAKWTAKTTTITIDANTGNHGSTTPETVTATYGSALPSFTAASGESGYSLTGYYTAATDGDKIINANGTLVASTSYADGSGNWNSEAATLTLYAQYEEIIENCYEFEVATSGSAPDVGDAVLGTGTAGMTVEAKGTSSAMGYNTYGIKFDKSGDKLKVVLPNDMKEGTVISIKQYSSSSGDNRGITLNNSSDTKVTDIIWNSTATAEEKTIDYTVTSSDGLKNTNIFYLLRNTNSYLKTVTVSNCGSEACTTSPTVTAGSNSSVTATTATVSCSSGISSLGSASCSISSYGFVLNTSTGPTLSNTTYEVGTTYTTTGTSFYKDLTSLTAGTTYYVRPYATNGNGTSYGTETSFTTLPSTPTFSPASGSTVSSSQSITITGHSGSTVYYAWATSAQTADAIYNSGSGSHGTTSAGTASTTVESGKTLYAISRLSSDNSAVASASYTIDATAPTLSSSTPANGATDVAVSGNIVMTFSENVPTVDGSKFSFSGGGAGTLNTASMTVSGATVTIPYSGLENETDYTVNIAAGAVQDAVGNANAATSFEFSTVAPTPTLTALVAGTLYEVPDMIPSGASLTSDDQFFEGLSANTKFELIGSASSSTTPKVNNKSSNDKTIAGITFDDGSMWFKGEASLTSNIPTTFGLSFIVPGTGKLYLYFDDDDTSTNIKLAKSGATGAKPTVSSGYSVVDVTEGTYYMYGTGTTSPYSFYGLKFVPTYAITLHDNNGGEHNGSAKVEDNGKTLLNISAPTRTGYDVEGYYGEAGCTTKIANAAGALQASKSVSEVEYTNSSSQWTKGSGATLYAKWKVAVYSVTLDANGGTINSGNVTEYTYGVGATLPNDVTAPSGSVFLGWYDGSTKVTAISNTATGDKSYKAKYGRTLYDSYFYQTYNTSSKTNDELTSDFPTYMDKSITNSANSSTPDKASSVTTPHDFSANGTTSCYNLKMANGDYFTLSALADVKAIRFYGWATSNRTITTTATLISGTGSDLSVAVTNISGLSSPNRTVNEYVVNISGTSGYSSSNYYDYKFTFSGETRIWGIYVEKYTNVPVTGVSLNKSSTTLTAGDTEQLTATIAPANATNKAVSWTSSNTSAATVSSAGLITAKAEGETTITVTTSDGSYTATCDVTVEAFSCDKFAGNVFDLTVTTSSTSYTIGGGTEQNLSSAATIMDDCSAYMGKLGSSTSTSCISSTKLKLDVSSNADKYVKITPICALRNGDVISCTGSSQEIAFSTTKEKVTAPKTSSYSYTVTPGDGLAGASTIYVWGATSSATVATLTITRPTSYVLTYNPNGGRDEVEAERLAAGANTLTTDVPTRAGYVFKEWNSQEDGEGTGYEPGALYTMPASASELYAKWVEPTAGEMLYASVIMTGKDAATAVNGTALVSNVGQSSDNDNSGYKLNSSSNCYFGITLANGNFLANDKIVIDIVAKGTTLDLCKAKDGASFYQFTSLTNNTDYKGDNALQMTITSDMVNPSGSVNLTNTIAIKRTGSSPFTIAHFVRSIKVYREICPNCMSPKSGVTTWSTTASDWIGPNGVATAVPDEDDVVYLDRAVTVGTDVTAHAKDVILGTSGTLTISSQGTMIAEHTIRKSGDVPTGTSDLIIDCDKDHQGALIFENPSGDKQAQGTVNFYTRSYRDGTSNKLQWQYVGYPFESGTDEDYDGYYINKYDEYGGRWIVMRNQGVRTIRAWEGLAISGDDEGGAQLQGTFAPTTNTNVSLTYGNAAGENLVGNSWTAPIQLENLAVSDFNGAEATIYIFNTGRYNDVDGKADAGTSGHTAGQWLAIPIEGANWSEWAGMKVIPAFQAFEVITPSATTLSLDYSKVVRSATNTMNAELHAPARRGIKAAEVDGYRIRVADSLTQTDMYLFEDMSFTTAFDNGWEGYYMPCDGRSAQLYAQTALGKMAVAALPDLEGTLLGFKPGKSSEYTFSFGTNAGVYYLNDIKTQTSTLMQEGYEYTFTWEDSDDTNRFMISATPFAKTTPTGIEDGSLQKVDGVQKVIYKDHMYIIRGGRVFDATGAMVK